LPPREALSGSLVATTPPARVSRTVVEGNSGARAVSLSKDSSIAYDPREHRFVNRNAASAASSPVEKEIRSEFGKPESATSAAATATSARTPLVVSPPRTSTPPPARNVVPPPAPRYSGGDRGGSSGSGSRGSTWSGSTSSSSSGSGRSSSSPAPAPSSHPSSGRPH